MGITREPIEPGEVVEDLATSGDGAVLLFLGVVRDRNRGREVSGLTYEVYEEMAEKVLSDLAREVRDRFGTERLALLHRVGGLTVGEVSTAIAVAAPHREEAYAASRFLLEALKERLPVWKEEHYVSGESAWLGGARDPEAEEGP